jgi:hypothetical protein
MERAHRSRAGRVQHGFQSLIDLDASTFAGTGEQWIVGELLARVLAERDDRLRYTRLVLRANGTLVDDFGLRDGAQLPTLLT